MYLILEELTVPALSDSAVAVLVRWQSAIWLSAKEYGLKNVEGALTEVCVRSLKLDTIALSSLGGERARFFDLRMVIDWKQFWNREMKELEEDDMIQFRSRRSHCIHRH
jgi:hypothetical protein